MLQGANGQKDTYPKSFGLAVPIGSRVATARAISAAAAINIAVVMIFLAMSFVVEGIVENTTVAQSVPLRRDCAANKRNGTLLVGVSSNV